jgi:hypothetical protein
MFALLPGSFADPYVVDSEMCFCVNSAFSSPVGFADKKAVLT